MSSPDSSAADASDNESPNRFNPFTFHEFSTSKRIGFQTSPFWAALSHGGGRALAKLATQANRSEANLDPQVCQKVLKEGLPDFRYALSCLKSAILPADITAFFHGIAVLMDTSTHGSEWDAMVFPTKTSRFKPDVYPPKSRDANSDTAVANAPHLTTVFKDKTGTVPRKRKRDASVTSSIAELSEAPLPSNVKKEKPSHKKVKRSASVDSEATADEGSGDGSAGPSGPVSARTRQSASGKKANSSTDKKSVASSKGKGKAKDPLSEKKKNDFKILLPLIEEACHKILDTKGKTFDFIHHPGLPDVTVTLSSVPGTRLVAPRSHHGAVSNQRASSARNEAGYTFKAPDLIPLEPILELVDPEHAVQPFFPCTMCSVFNVKCFPQAIGVGCVHCSLKKWPQYCDHSRNAEQLARLSQDLEAIREFMDPSVRPLDANALKESSELILSASRLFERLRAAHEVDLRRYLDSMTTRARALGDQGFNSLFRFSPLTEPAVALNSLIAAYFETGAKPSDSPSKDFKPISDIANEGEDTEEDENKEEDAKGSDANTAGGPSPAHTS
ncbi:hypothetical protein C8R44DRAFT_890003 [Mycena epipterygia]|nr:hypothetical protein C8R44DRAFT_890003 [Mycena epipterygia]